MDQRTRAESKGIAVYVISSRNTLRFLAEDEDLTNSEFEKPVRAACGPKHTPLFKLGWLHAIDFILHQR